MVKVNECLKLGDEYFLATDVAKTLKPRINAVIPEDLEEIVEE